MGLSPSAQHSVRGREAAPCATQRPGDRVPRGADHGAHITHVTVKCVTSGTMAVWVEDVE
jgi:hypothetical protein